ncbi:MAG: SMP-30/gluconolactonase/LRE family protein [Acidobacteriota bacterium]
MKQLKLLSLILLSCIIVTRIEAQTPDDYPPGPDSKPQPGVPKGEVLKFTFQNSKIFPGTFRDYSIYIPAQYSPERPACVYINQDGLQYEAPTVFDNLIARKEMPVTIGVFIMHGRVLAADANTALDRFNRSFEYDGLGDNYARFLLEELLPEVEKKTASDGRAIRLSRSGNDRAIGGQSSGAIAAFTAAWERPDAFSRVYSAIGTYVGLRGGDRYSTLIRKYEPKAIRVFLQDGSNDNNSYAGDWWMANQTLERALVFAGYEVNHVWGEGAHNGRHATAVFPDAMRWLWKDWPQPVKAGKSKNTTLDALLLPGEDWQLVGEGYRGAEGPAVNSRGEVFFNDIPDSKSYKIGLDGKVSLINPDSKKSMGQAFGPDGRLYVIVGAEEKVVAFGPDGKPTPITDGFIGNDITVANNGNVYVTQPPANNSNEPSKVWLIRPRQQGQPAEKQLVDTGLRYANGVTLSPDQTLLYVDDYRSHWVYSYRIQADGTLAFKQRFYWLHVSDNADDSGADGLKVDREGRLYVATRLGIQVCDQAGKVQCILPTPNGRAANLAFGGDGFDTLFVTAGDRVYKRKLKVKGAQSWDAPLKPAAPRL